MMQSKNTYSYSGGVVAVFELASFTQEFTGIALCRMTLSL